MKNQILFSSKDKSKTLKFGLPQFLFGALRVKHILRNTKEAPSDDTLNTGTAFRAPDNLVFLI